MMKKLTLDVAFKSNEHFPDCNTIEIDMSLKQFSLLAKIKYLTNTEGVFSVNIDNICEVRYLISDGENLTEDKEFRADVQYFTCYPNTDSIYFFAQSKYDASIQIESESFNLKQLQQ